MVEAGAPAGPAALRTGLLSRMMPTYVAVGAYLLLAAMILDGLDGRLARLTRKTSDFGAQLDSLADVVSFGVAPAVLVLCLVMPALGGHWQWPAGEKLLSRVAWVAVAVYVACAALRLARFAACRLRGRLGPWPAWSFCTKRSSAWRLSGLRVGWWR